MKDGTAASRIDRLIYARGNERRRSKSQTREGSSPRSPTSSGHAYGSMATISLLDTNPMQQAVFRGCVECIRMLVEEPPYFSVDKTCGPEGLRPIHIAAREGHISVLRFLAGAGVNVDKCDAHGSTGLHHAAWGGQLRSARWLLRHGAALTLDRRGKTPIDVAATLGHTEIVTLLTNHSSCATLNAAAVTSKPPQLNNSFAPQSVRFGEQILHKSVLETTQTSCPNRPISKLKNSKFKAQSQQDLSSSGNFSLGTTTATSSGTNSPLSLSPAAHAQSTCNSCTDPQPTEVGVKNCVESNGKTVGDSRTFPNRTGVSDRSGIIGLKQSKPADDSPTVASFYLHPPRTSSSSVSESSETLGSQRKHVTVAVTVEPFYLHPPPSPPPDSLSPETLTGSSGSDESQEETPGVRKPEMGPVTPVTSSSDFVPTAAEQKTESSPEPSRAPSPPSPPPKAKAQPPTPSPDKTPTLDPPPPKPKAQPPTPSPIDPPPPPPPPPMPKATSSPRCPRPLHPTRIRTSSLSNYSEENEYEDIDEMSENLAGNPNRKLNRSVSAPAPPNRNPSMTDPLSHIQPKGVPPGSRRPFIPPNFPDPPKDALIKPSEYLKSIQQNKSKYEPLAGGAGGGATGGGARNGRASSGIRIDEVIKVLNGADMPCVPEESNSDDEVAGVTTDHVNHSHYGESTGGNIRLEELKRVNLRKTPMSRTLSAPVLGRVLPDAVVAQKPIQGAGLPATSTQTLNVNGKSSVAPPPRAAIIAELAESSQVGGVREWKEELRRRQVEEEKAVAKEMATIYSPLKFVSEVPEADESGTPIPEWKRQMMAKKAAEKAKKEAEEQRRLEAEAKRASAIPPWKRQLLQRRDSDSKSAQ